MIFNIQHFILLIFAPLIVVRYAELHNFVLKFCLDYSGQLLNRVETSLIQVIEIMIRMRYLLSLMMVRRIVFVSFSEVI